MTENKRFKEVYPDIIRSNYNFTDNGKGISDKEVCDLLNALYDENEQLKQLINDKTCDNTRMKKVLNNTKMENYDLKEENDKLKSLLECSREEANDYCEELMEKDEFVRLYKKENEQLKKAEILANSRGEMIGFATALIDDLGSETMKEMWDKFKEEKYEDWRKLE